MRGVWLLWALSRGAFAGGIAVVHAARHTALLPSDVAVTYFGAARHLMHGAVPYADFAYEYPPGTLPFVGADWVLGGRTPGTFVVGWCLLMLCLDAFVLQRVGRLRCGAASGLVWVIGLCLIGPTAVLRNDLVVVAAFVAACVATLHRGTFRGGAWWLAGVLAKLWPAVPLAALLLLDRRGRARLATGAATVLAGATALLAAAGALGPMARYLSGRQGRRPIEIESVWATAGWVRALVSGRPAPVVASFGSRNLVTGRVVADLATVATLAVQVACIVLVWLVARRPRVRCAPVLAWGFAVYVAALLVVAPVLSPQYCMWLLAASCVVLGVVGWRPARTFVVVTLVACGLTQLVYPALYTALEHSQPVAIAVLILRNLALLAATATAATGLRRTVRTLEGSAGDAGTDAGPRGRPPVPRARRTTGRAVGPGRAARDRHSPDAARPVPRT